MAKNVGAGLRYVLDARDLELLDLAARAAERLGIPLFAVGGLPRDLMLGRTSHDLDLVVEGDAVELAQSLATQHGGSVDSHRRFGTATWRRESSPDGAHRSVGALTGAVSLDLITARTEIYPKPAQLPRVRPATIEGDLRRRDFSINAIAIRLDGDHFGQLLDPLHGSDDVQSKRLRVLHDRSFVDDPTRMYRAARYEQRLAFHLDRQTRSLLREGLRWVHAVSGERLRHELDLILLEARCAVIVRRLSGLGLLQSAHPSLPADSRSLRRLGRISPPDRAERPIRRESPALGTRWRLWLLDLRPSALRSVGRRLVFGRRELESVLAAAELYQGARKWALWRHSKLTFKLDQIPLPAIMTVHEALSAGRARQALDSYLHSWRHMRAHTTGRDLRELGLKPGPRYRSILQSLRAAWIDGDVQDLQGERALIERMMRPGASQTPRVPARSTAHPKD